MRTSSRAFGYGALVLALLAGTVEGRTGDDLQEALRTDGDCLPTPPRAFGPLEAAGLFADSRRACAGPCETPFGQVLGTADGAEARSNCTSRCVRPDLSFLDLDTGELALKDKATADGRLHYVGITYQCVGYARHWWMKNLSLTFGDVDDAHHILYLTDATDVRTGKRIALGRSVNGSAERAPQRGDLLVYVADRDDPQWRFGHVAVIVNVDREQGLVALAEENYDNARWQDPEAFARQIQLFEVNGRYTLVDVPEGARSNATGGRIAGWVYPMH